MIKKLLSATVAVCLACTLLSSAAMAEKSSFSDVTSPAYDWAIPDVESMTRVGIIKGYTDGTFRPANPIRKIEMLLLMARVAGFTNEDYAPYTEYATDRYAAMLADYDLGESYNRYKPEVSFLLYKGIIGIDELDSLLGEADESVKRYEAAVLLTKLLGAEDEINNTAVVLDYTDYTSIPADARGYVEYVTNHGIMNGIGDNSFAPKGSVTRVQAAVLLRRIIDKLDYSTLSGVVSSVSSKSISLYSESAGTDLTVSVNSDVSIIIDGSPAKLSEIKKDDQILVLYSGKQVAAIEVLSKEVPTVSGTLLKAIFDDDDIFVYLEDSKGDEQEFLLILDNGPELTLDGKVCDFYDLGPGLYAVIETDGNEIVSLAAYSSDKTTEDKPPVKRGIVSGTIASMLIDDEPLITISADGKKKQYIVDPDAEVYVDGDYVSLYDLRLGTYVEMEIEDDVVVYINTAAASSFRISGEITHINTRYGYIDIYSFDDDDDVRINLDMVDNESLTVIVDGVTGASLALRKLKEGQYITVVGTKNNGSLTASTILLLPD